MMMRIHPSLSIHYLRMGYNLPVCVCSTSEDYISKIDYMHCVVTTHTILSECMVSKLKIRQKVVNLKTKITALTVLGA